MSSNDRNWLACRPSAAIFASRLDADVDELVRLVRAPQEQLADLPGLETLGDLLGEVERVARGRKDRVDGGLADGAVVRVVDPLVVHEQHGRVVRHHHVGAELANRPGQAPAEGERRLDLAVGLVEEVDGIDADLGRRGSLLALAKLGKGRHIGVRVVAALVAARDDEVAGARALGDPARHRSGAAELDVVGMRGHDEDAFGGLELVVRHRRCADRSVTGRRPCAAAPRPAALRDGVLRVYDVVIQHRESAENERDTLLSRRPGTLQA